LHSPGRASARRPTEGTCGDQFQARSASRTKASGPWPLSSPLKWGKPHDLDSPPARTPARARPAATAVSARQTATAGSRRILVDIRRPAVLGRSPARRSKSSRDQKNRWVVGADQDDGGTSVRSRMENHVPKSVEAQPVGAGFRLSRRANTRTADTRLRAKTSGRIAEQLESRAYDSLELAVRTTWLTSSSTPRRA